MTTFLEFCGRTMYFFRSRSILFLLVFFATTPLSMSAFLAGAQTASGQPPTQATQNTPSTPSSPDQSAAEMTTHDEVTTFKVNVKLVLVRVVVRDVQGHAVGNLHRENFELSDNHKPQVITHFSLEHPGSEVAREQKVSEPTPGQPGTNTKLPAVPERYIAYVFDDVHLTFGDLSRARQAAQSQLATLQPTDRAAIFSTSGQTTLDFTEDRAQLSDALLRLQPHPIGRSGTSECPDISYYMADLIQNKQDSRAEAAAIQDALACLNLPMLSAQQVQVAQLAARVATVASTARQLNIGNQETHVALATLRDVVRRISVMPGQRSVVVVSPGFLTPELNLEEDYMSVVDGALHSAVIISALDARGLYTVAPGGDISKPGPTNAVAASIESQYEIDSASAQDNVLANLAYATGGAFVFNNNDLNAGLKAASATPEYFYTIGFSPQNLKLDGSFHTLKISLNPPGKLTLQARRGYYAPKHAAGPAEEAKQEIEEALFSQEELHDLPVEMHTQFFKTSDMDAKLTVLARVDVRHLHFRKMEGRNANELTVVSALFNRNGNFVQGSEKSLRMRLKDETLENKLASGVTLKTSFAVKPGSYLVRLVVRDAESQLMSAQNGAIEIP